VATLRARHTDVHVIGSVDLVHSLLADDLFDVLQLWVYLVVLGRGKKVFPDGATPSGLRLLEPAFTGPTGAVSLRYGPTGAPPATGDMSLPDRGIAPA
jgi:dihydrofolate reductase